MDRLANSNDEKGKVLAEKEQLIKDLKLQSAELQTYKRVIIVEFNSYGDSKDAARRDKATGAENEVLKSENDALKTQKSFFDSLTALREICSDFKVRYRPYFRYKVIEPFKEMSHFDIVDVESRWYRENTGSSSSTSA
nr:hypothetical protein Iba_chr09aCG9730 [Ipomoea batatas]